MKSIYSDPFPEEVFERKLGDEFEFVTLTGPIPSSLMKEGYAFGPPVDTEKYSKQELEDMGVAGLYRLRPK